MTNSIYDVIVIGAGSIGVPVALALSAEKLKVLVIDALPSAGQGNNKKAIGGLRATHSDKGKIRICLRSLEIFANWQEQHGDDIQWMSNGYSFPAYTEKDEHTLKETMKIQHSYGLNIEWISPEEYRELVPGINMTDLRGSTYSPEDGSASPLLAINALYYKSLQQSAQYRFNEQVIALEAMVDSSYSVITNKGSYTARYVINAAGNYAAEIARLLNIEIPVRPDNHEAGISEPVKRFFGPMVVDIRPTKDSANFYFYQNYEGQVVFCLTPDPPIWGIDNDSTSVFLPQITKRMLNIYPRLANLKVRRTWRGQYPMTPDGFPIVGITKEHPNFINAAGVCGQGFMLGPGLGELITRLILEKTTPEDLEILEGFSLYRKFSSTELLK
ncbi:MAG: FAD-binding oxidoreductase [Candidatus Cloacimonetes bacterium]|nr:FAD-binding oxidoreductase [Candidatus Cloacimonadota bacterium]